jgi:hypothetical protein
VLVADTVTAVEELITVADDKGRADTVEVVVGVPGVVVAEVPSRATVAPGVILAPECWTEYSEA